MHYFLLGPSGVGKTWFGNWLQDERGYLHILIDRPDGKDGLKEEGLEESWKEGFAAFAEELQSRAETEDKNGCVLTVPSVNVFPVEIIGQLAGHGIGVRYLYGPKEKCIEEFVNREKREGHPERDRNFWSTNNEPYYGQIGAPELAPYRGDVITPSGARLSGEEIAKLLNIE